MKAPRLARALLRWLTRAEDREAVLGDVDEVFAEQSSRALAARLWYWRQTAGAAAVWIARACRQAVGDRRGSFVRGMILDVRQGARTLTASPGFSLTAAASLAIGIAATTSLYGAVRIAMLDTLPLERPEALRLLYWTGPDTLSVSQHNSGGYSEPASGRAFRTNVSYPAFESLRATDPDRVVGFNFLRNLTVIPPGRSPMAATGLIVSGNAFGTLRIPMALGRGLTVDDDRLDAPPAVVLTHSFWRRALNEDRGVIGSTVALNGSSFHVVGVTAPEFRGLATGGRLTPLSDAIVPLAAQPLVWLPKGEPSFVSQTALWVRVFLRVAEGGEEIQRRDLREALTRTLLEGGLVSDSQASEVDVTLRPGARGVDPLSTAAERPLRVLSIVVLVVLLIACVNIAVLMLTRAVGRQREIAVRQALGAGRVRVVRQLLTEALLLAGLGCVFALTITIWSRPLIANMLAAGLNAHAAPLPLDWRMAAVAVAVTTATAVAFGLLPAVLATRGGLATRLRLHMIGASAPRLTVGRVLLGVQIAASVPLLAGAGLLLRTLHNLDRTPLGFDPGGLVVFRTDPIQSMSAPDALSDERLDPAAAAAFVRHLLERLRALPGVQAATVVENPLLSGVMSNSPAVIDGIQRMIHMNGVGPDFFETLGIHIVAGRAPALRDQPSDGVVVNEAAARQYFGGHPLGRRFRLGPRDVEVIGVAADAKYDSVRGDVVPTVYDPYVRRASGRPLYFVLRSAAGLSTLEPSLRRVVAEVAPAAAISDLRSQAQYVAQLSDQERLLARLLAIFGVFTLVLACVGLYGTTAYNVARRTSEIGIRMALGAQRGDVVWMILRSALVIALSGLVVGVLAAAWTGALVRSFLYRVEPNDPGTLAAAALALLLVSLLAAVLPSHRASRLEPLTALRRE